MRLKREIVAHISGRADGGHWSEYAIGTGWGHRYRLCNICGLLVRNRGQKALIHKGKAPRR